LPHVLQVRRSQELVDVLQRDVCATQVEVDIFLVQNFAGIGVMKDEEVIRSLKFDYRVIS